MVEAETVAAVGASGFVLDCSPELTEAAACFGCGRMLRLAARKIARPCQNDAPERNKEKGNDRRVRGCRNSPYGELFAGGSGEMAGSCVGSLGALGEDFLGHLREGEVGIK